jgi:hypothetical protein
MNPEIKKHVLDFLKGLLAAIVVAGMNFVIQHIGNLDLGHLLLPAQAVAAVAAVKTKM